MLELQNAGTLEMPVWYLKLKCCHRTRNSGWIDAVTNCDHIDCGKDEQDWSDLVVNAPPLYIPYPLVIPTNCSYSHDGRSSITWGMR